MTGWLNASNGFLAILAASTAALAAAYIGQYAFNLHPCELCLYQRIPYALAGLTAIIGLLAHKRCACAAPALFTLSALIFAANSALAAFHSGVERKWWPGLEGCSMPSLQGSADEIIAAIRAAPAVRCDEIPWELFGLSMANYNVFACAGLALFSAAMALRTWRRPPA